MKRLMFALTVAALAMTGCTSSNHKQPEQQEKLAKLHYQLGVDALRKGMLPKAFDELMQSNSLNPNQPEVLDALAYAWLLRSDMAKAEEFYRKSLRAKPTAATENNYANLLNKLGRFQEAEAMALKALDDPRYPNQDLAFINLGDAQLGQGRFEDALNSYGQAQLFNSDSLLPQLKTANAYARHNHPREAEALYRTLLQKEKDSRAVAEGLFDLLESQNRLAEARKLLNDFSKNSSIPQDKAWAWKELEQMK